MSPLNILLIVVLVLLLIGGLPPFGLHTYGPWPSSIAGTVLLVILILLLLGRI